MIKILAVILFFLVIIIGEERGVNSILSLIGNIFVILASIYAMTNGYNPIMVSIAATVILAAIILFGQNGVNEKNKTSFVSVLIVIILMISASCIVGNRTAVSGYNDLDVYEEDAMYLSTDINVNMTDVQIALIIFGILGAIVDTSIAISTSVYEVHRNNENLTAAELFKSGIVMGKDIIGTTANTLLFTCIGESMMMFMLFKNFNYSFEKIINSKAMFQQFIFTIFGGIGCVIIIPITAVLISNNLKKKSSRLPRKFIRRNES